jgi:predicted unusual protein kinase regulating ubiquinone biosynthesis (AarF/ABC1/UbiB family)
MNPTLAELLSGLPEDERDAGPARAELAALFSELAGRPVPTGRLARMWSLGSLSAGLAAGYLAWWVRGGLQGTEARERALSETHLRAALKLLGRMGYLRGAVMKAGQMLAAWPEVVPTEFADLLGRLHFEAPPMHYALLREHVRGELGADPSELFDAFEPQAVAAASLGQVHRARLKGSGRPVAVKIQYPGIARTIRSDFANLAALSQGVRFTRDYDNVRAQLEDIAAMLERETDYEREAANLELAREAFGPEEGIEVPRVQRELSSRQVLTMDWVEGLPLAPFLATSPSQAQRDRAGELVLRACFRLYYRARMVYADPGPANFLFRADGTLGLVDFGCCHRFSDEEFEYAELAERAISGEGADLRQAIERAVDLPAGRRLDDEHRALMEQYCRWTGEPLLHEGAFDFTDGTHFRRGVELYRAMVRRRMVRSNPLNTWLMRLVFGARAILTHLGARVEYGRIRREETLFGDEPGSGGGSAPGHQQA